MTKTIDPNAFMQPEWPAPANIRAYTTLRQSQLSLPSNTNTPTSGNVNRPLLRERLHLPNEPIWLRQTHSTIVLKATAANRSSEGDASFTDEANQVCAIMTADCLPLLVCTQQGTHIAAIHAGWRGLANGIIEKTIQSLNLPAEDLLVWLGPAIGPEQFLIRQDVFDIFTQKDPDAELAFKAISSEQWLANIYFLATLRLKKMGINQIYGGNFCTFSDEERFYSYRRNNGTPDRMVSLIWMDN